MKRSIKALILLHGQAMSMDKSILRNIIGCYENKNLLQAFCGDNIISKVLKKLYLVESLLKHRTIVFSPDIY